jgi:membrane associated rhomboid family serine protease
MTLNNLNMHPLEAILTWCHEAAPNPWYPSVFAQASGIPREALDPYLDELRLGGLVHLTDWVQGRGQGYALTPAGADVLQNPRSLERLRANGVPRLAAPPPLVRPQGEGAVSSWDAGEKVRAALLNPSVPVVTACVALANVFVFLVGLVMAIQQQIPVGRYIGMEGIPAILDAVGAVNARQILDGQWWRLLTSCFVHIGLLHLGVNMYALYIFGPIVERLYGHWRFLVLYLVAGFGGSCIGVLLQPEASLAGASGAICGLLGAFAIWTMLNRRHLPPRLVSSWTRNAVINTILIALVSAVPGVSWSGHLGGGVAGIIAGGLLNYNRIGAGWRRWLALLGVLAIPAVCVGVLNRAPAFSQKWAQIVEPQEMNRYIDHVRAILHGVRASEVGNRAEALADEKPTARDPQKVRDTVGGLEKARAGLREAADLLRQAGPFHSQFVESARQAFLEWIEARARLFEIYQRCLAAGGRWSPKDQRELQDQVEKTEEAGTRWKQFLKKE